MALILVKDQRHFVFKRFESNLCLILVWWALVFFF
jgi:hypothetical protein